MKFVSIIKYRRDVSLVEIWSKYGVIVFLPLGGSVSNTVEDDLFL